MEGHHAERYRSGRNGGASKASCRETGTWVRIPPSPPNSAFAPFGGEGGIQALRGSRRSGHESLLVFSAKFPHSLHLAERVGFRRCAAPAAPGTNPCSFSPPNFRIRSIWRRGWDSGAARLPPLRARIPARFLRQISAFAPFGGEGGIQALRGSRRFGHESLLVFSPNSAFAPFGGEGGIQALRGSRRFGHESLAPSMLAGAGLAGSVSRSGAGAARERGGRDRVRGRGPGRLEVVRNGAPGTGPRGRAPRRRHRH